MVVGMQSEHAATREPRSLLHRLRARYDPTNIVDQIEMDLLEQELDGTTV